MHEKASLGEVGIKAVFKSYGALPSAGGFGSPFGKGQRLVYQTSLPTGKPVSGGRLPGREQALSAIRSIVEALNTAAAKAAVGDSGYLANQTGPGIRGAPLGLLSSLSSRSPDGARRIRRTQSRAGSDADTIQASELERNQKRRLHCLLKFENIYPGFPRFHRHRNHGQFD
jgi:hypothetical protein